MVKRPHVHLAFIFGAALLVLALAGCTTATPAEPTTAAQPTIEPTAEPTAEPTDEITEEPTEAATEEPTELPTETPTEEATEEPTATATEEPTEEATDIAHLMAYENVSFVLDPTFADGFTAETVDAVPSSDDSPFWVATPRHIEITLDGYILPDTFHQPQIFIYPVEQFMSMNEIAADNISQMMDFLEAQPADPESIPFLPIFNAAQFFPANVRYMDFQSGTGVRFLTQYGQAVNPVNNRELFYTYQGITADGAYYVAAILPISHPDLPASFEDVPFEEMPQTEEEMNAYFDEMKTLLTGADGSTFTPTLTQLDALVQSITVEAPAE